MSTVCKHIWILLGVRLFDQLWRWKMMIFSFLSNGRWTNHSIPNQAGTTISKKGNRSRQKTNPPSHSGCIKRKQISLWTKWGSSYTDPVFHEKCIEICMGACGLDGLAFCFFLGLFVFRHSDQGLLDLHDRKGEESACETDAPVPSFPFEKDFYKQCYHTWISFKKWSKL